MVELTRAVRFCVSPDDREDRGRAGRNTFAAWPSPVGISAFFELEVCCRGEVDPITGYLINISEIDKSVRHHCVPVIARAMRERPALEPARLLPALIAALPESLASLVHSITWRITPYHAVSMSSAKQDEAELRETFEFAAAHRLNCRGLSDHENRRLFGKCNNPSGHGHNYRLEVSVAVPANPGPGRAFDHLALERIVDEKVIRRFDHMNLDVDTEEFRDRNSSVENIARSCHELLAGPLAEAGGRLVRVRVWETEKTSCTYPAGA